MEVAVFVQQLRTEKQTGNVASAQNGRARITLSSQFKQNVIIASSNRTGDKFLSHLCSKLYRVTIKEIDTFNVVLKRNY